MSDVLFLERSPSPGTQTLGLPGELQWIEVGSPQVDMTYQRPLSLYQVTKIRRDFDPDLLGVLLISEREDGSYWVLDGQHRLAALISMGFGDQQVPAMVYHHLSLKTEAKIFALANKNRLYLSPQHAFRARLLSGDPLAEAINHTVQAYGFHLNYWKSLPGQEPGMARPEGMLSAVGEIESIYRDFADPKMLDKTLGIIADAWGPEVIGVSAAVLRGVAIFLYNFDESMERERLVGLLSRTTPLRLVTEARDVGSSGGPSAVTALLIKRYNHHLEGRKRLPTIGLRKQNQRRG